MALLYTKSQADERAAEINKNGSGARARVGYHVTNGEPHFPVHVLPGLAADESPYTESGR